MTNPNFPPRTPERGAKNPNLSDAFNAALGETAIRAGLVTPSQEAQSGYTGKFPGEYQAVERALGDLPESSGYEEELVGILRRAETGDETDLDHTNRIWEYAEKWREEDPEITDTGIVLRYRGLAETADGRINSADFTEKYPAEEDQAKQRARAKRLSDRARIVSALVGGDFRSGKLPF